MPSLPKRNWKKEIHQFLVSEISLQVGVAAFDFDNTLVRGDFGEAVMFSLIDKGLSEHLLQFSSYFENQSSAELVYSQRKKEPVQFHNFIDTEYNSHLNNRGLSFAYRWTSFLFSGYSSGELHNESIHVWNQNQTSPNGVKPYLEMLDLIQFLLESNWKVYIVTASPSICIQAISNHFQIQPENVIGMNLSESKGRLTQKIIEPYTYGEGKVEALSIAGQRADLAFGDSFNDYPLLQSARSKGILLDRGNLDLVQKCLDMNCFVQSTAFHTLIKC